MIHGDVLSVFNNRSDGWLSETIGTVNTNCVNARVMQDIESDFHIHESSDEFFLVIAGRLELDIESETVELEKGDTFTVQSGMRHRARAVGRAELITIISD